MKQYYQTAKTIELASLPAARSGSRATIYSFINGTFGRLGCAVAMLFSATSLMADLADVRNVTAEPIRMTIPISSTGFYTNLVTITLGPSATQGVDAIATLSATGVPTGAGAVFSSLTVTNTTTNNLTVTVGFTLNYTNVAQGEYDMAIEAAGNNTWRLPIPVAAGYQWASTTAAGGTASGANWVGGVAPGVGDTIIIPDVTFGNNTTPSILVTNDTEIGALRDVHNGNSTYPNINIADGKTLAITGVGGYRQLRDSLTSNSRAYIQASGAGTLLVSNANANFDLFVYAENSQNFFKFDQLNTLKIDANRISVDDNWAYPNVSTNGGTTSAPRRFTPLFYLAKTNILRATQTDANNWTDQNRSYSFVIARARSGGGTGTDFGMRFGLQNEFYCDSVLLGGAGEQCDSGNDKQIDFNPNLTGSKLLYMRGPNGGRMANLTLGDAATPGGSQSSGTKMQAILTGGTIDILADRLYLGRNATNASGAQATGLITYSTGTLDVNDAYLGYQTGSDAVVGGSAGVGYCQGTINLMTNAVLIVNSNLVLGYTEATAGGSPTFAPQTGYGQLNLSGTAVAKINNISAGGVTGATLGNANQKISVTGGTLVLSNKMSSASAPVNTLNVSGGGVLSLPNLTSTSQTNVFVKNLSGSGGVISLPGLTTGGTYIIASYSDTIAITWSLSLPSGFYGFLTIDTSAQLVKAVVSTSPPKTCVWVGYPGTDWDTTSLNWKELVTGNPTNFNQGDAVLFDDSASNATVNVAEAVIPAGGTTITNNTLNYSFSGSNIEGTGGTVKTGTGSLTVGNTHSPLLTVGGGALTVNGTLGGGLTLNGTSAVNNGTINGAVNLAVTGASLDNNSTITTTPGALSMVAGCTMTNESTGTINNGSASDTTYPAGTTFVNKGQINNLAKRISVNGVWINDGGIITDNTVIDDATGYAGAGRFTMQTTGELYIGANGITVQGRFDNILGSRTYINVDKGASPTSQKVIVDYFGDMRGTFVMNNIGATPYVNGDTFTVMQQEYSIALTNASNAANQTASVSPAAAGVGLQWNPTGTRSQTTTPPPSAIRTIAVTNAPTTPAPVMTTTNVGGNLVISWPSTNISYQLKVQTNSLGVGLSTNWVPVAGSEYTNVWTIPVISTNPAVFFRLSNQTN